MQENTHKKKVFVSGCYDMLHSGHVAFFKAASQYGDLYVGIGSDATIEDLKHRKTVYSEKERLYMVKSIRYVKDAYINPGSGMLDFVETMNMVQPDIFVVNSDGGSDVKRELCAARGIEYVELERVPDEGLTARSTTSLRTGVKSHLPYRVDLAGTWIDQPYVSQYGSGWALTVSIEPTVEFMERGGMSTSTRNAARKIWPFELPNYNEEMLARLL
ncbi:MAG: adenylyltransferase/cytidyltransferase family protein, partial [Muribaculaceae bacterium]|nr:adenylyltransferase/cytidyltransferase family protein [Muribaculaceae bacterium]